jgi:hypothetical protein
MIDENISRNGKTKKMILEAHLSTVIIHMSTEFAGDIVDNGCELIQLIL